MADGENYEQYHSKPIPPTPPICWCIGVNLILMWGAVLDNWPTWAALADCFVMQAFLIHPFEKGRGGKPNFENAKHKDRTKVFKVMSCSLVSVPALACLRSLVGLLTLVPVSTCRDCSSY